MKKLLLFLFTISVLSSAAQTEEDETRDVNSVKKLMPNTYSRILENASDEWGTNYEMVRVEVRNQSLAFKKYLGLNKIYDIPDDVYEKIRMKSVQKWSKNDCMECIIKFSDSISIDPTAACYNANWQMVVYEMEKQIQAYLELSSR